MTVNDICTYDTLIQVLINNQQKIGVRCNRPGDSQAVPLIKFRHIGRSSSKAIGRNGRTLTPKIIQEIHEIEPTRITDIQSVAMGVCIAITISV